MAERFRISCPWRSVGRSVWGLHERRVTGQQAPAYDGSPANRHEGSSLSYRARVLRKFLWVGFTAFGAARWINLYAAFVRAGLIREQDFVRDLAIAQTLPGAGFVNLTALCGMRLGGVRIAVIGLALVLLPGLLAIVAAMVFVSTNRGSLASFTVSSWERSECWAPTLTTASGFRITTTSGGAKHGAAP
jgi:hypothetical protein